MKNTLNTSGFTDHEALTADDNGLDPVFGSGFEEEQPEPDFDERI